MAGNSFSTTLRLHNNNYDIGGYITVIATVTVTGTSTTTAKFSASISGIPLPGETGSASVSITVKDLENSNSKSKSVAISGTTSSSSGDVTGLTIRNTSSTSGGDRFSVTMTIGNATTTINVGYKTLWTTGSGSQSGTSTTSTTKYNHVWIGPGLQRGSSSAYQTNTGTAAGTITWGYVQGSDGSKSNQTSTYPIYDYIKWANQATTNYIQVNADGTCKYGGVTYTCKAKTVGGVPYRFGGWNQHTWEQKIGNWGLANGATLFISPFFEATPSYTVSYNANGGSGAPSSQTKYQGTNLTLSSTKPTRTGYIFLGWAFKSSAPVAEYLSGATFSEDLSANVTLYAIWAKCVYVCTGGTTWKEALPYVCMGGTDWRRAEPYICTGGSTWK